MVGVGTGASLGSLIVKPVAFFSTDFGSISRGVTFPRRNSTGGAAYFAEFSSLTSFVMSVESFSPAEVAVAIEIARTTKNMGNTECRDLAIVLLLSLTPLQLATQ